MRIVHLVAGAGDMYCGGCAREVSLLGELARRGHELNIVQLYTPMRVDGDPSFRHSPIHLGGVSLYLEQTLPGFHLIPWPLRRILDSKLVLSVAGKAAVRTQPETLGPMTVATLDTGAASPNGAMVHLVSYIDGLPKPDVVVITNSLLSGIAPVIRQRLDVPIVCGLMGEDSFIDNLPSPYREEAIRLLRANAASIDRFIAPSLDHAATMAQLLEIDAEDIVLAPAGVRTELFRQAPPRQSSEPFVIGYLSSIDRRKGLDLLVDAVRLMVRDVRRNVKLLIAGKPLNDEYWQQIRAKLATAWLDDRVEYVGEVDFAGKVAFLERCSVFCVPSRIPEARGMAVMEAMAAGLTVVAPASGVFPELLRDGNAGLLFEPEGVEELTSALAWTMDNPERAAQIGDTAAAHIRATHSVAAMADAVIDAYSGAIRAKN